MNYEDYIKTGNTVFYKGEPVVLDGIYDIEFDNFATEEDMNQCPQLCIAHIYFEGKGEDRVPITELQPLRHVDELSEKELQQLRREMRFGGFFYSAYKNSHGIDKHELADVADSYLDALENGVEFPENGDTPVKICGWRAKKPRWATKSEKETQTFDFCRIFSRLSKKNIIFFAFAARKFGR